MMKKNKNMDKDSLGFNYDLDFDSLNFREHPEYYRVGKGEQGVLLVEPYKSEILPHWRFKTEAIARVSAEKIYALFEAYLQNDDFVGADMARKFLQMGFTRARRYANYKGGRKYQPLPTDTNEGKMYPYSSGSTHKGNPKNPLQDDAFTNEKARAAAIFKDYWFKAKAQTDYVAQKAQFMAQLGGGGD
jgi:hypothetical protein